MDTGAEVPIAPESAAKAGYLRDERMSKLLAMMADGHTTVRAAYDADMDLSFASELEMQPHQAVTMSFHGLKGGKTWLFAVCVLTKAKFVFILRDYGPSYIITPPPHRRGFVIDRQRPDGAGGGSGLWVVTFTYTDKGVASVDPVDGAPVPPDDIMTMSLNELLGERSRKSTPRTVAAVGTASRRMKSIAGMRGGPVPGRYGHIPSSFVSETLGHCSAEKLQVLGTTGAMGLPTELYGATRARCLELACKCWACTFARIPIMKRSPYLEWPLTRLPLIGEFFYIDFSRRMEVSDLVWGYITAVTFIEARSARTFPYGLVTHDGFFDAMQTMINITIRDHGVQPRVFFGDSDTTWFVPARLDRPYTARATEIMNANPGTILKAAEATDQARSFMENRSRPLYGIMYSFLVRGYISKKGWWLSLRHASRVLNALPLPGSMRALLQKGHTPTRAWTGAFDDYSRFHNMFAMTRFLVYNTKSSALEQQTEDGLWVGFSDVKVAAEVLRFRDQKVITTSHIRVDDDLNHRPLAIQSIKGLLNNTDAATSTSLTVPTSQYNANLASLFNNAPPELTMANGIIEFSSLSKQPIRMVLMRDDERGEKYLSSAPATVPTALLPPATAIEPASPPPAAIEPTMAPPPTDPAARAAYERMRLQAGALASPTAPATPTLPPIPPHLKIGRKLNRLPDSVQITMQQPNPVLDARRARYEQYMSATNLGDYRIKSAGTADMVKDFKAGYLRFSDERVYTLLGESLDPMLTTRLPAAVQLTSTTAHLSAQWTFDEATTQCSAEATTLAEHICDRILDPSPTMPEPPVPPHLPSNGLGGGGAHAAACTDATTQQTDDACWPVRPRDSLMDTGDTDHARYVSDFKAQVREVDDEYNMVPDSQVAATMAMQMQGTTDGLPSEPMVSPLSADEIASIAHDVVNQMLGDDGEDDSLAHMVNAITKSIDSRLEILGPHAPAKDETAPYIKYAFSVTDLNSVQSGAEKTLPDPLTVNELKSHKHKMEYLQSMLEEWDTVNKKFKCFRPIPLAEALRRRRHGEIIHIVPTKWVWTKKPTRFKSRLVACQCVGQYDIPFEQKWSPTLGLDSMRLIYIIGVKHKCDFTALDVKGAYLYGKRPKGEPDVYVRLPPGLKELAEYMQSKGMKVDPMFNSRTADGKPLCWFLDGNLYGTITAGRTFWLFITKWLVEELGFVQATPDPCIFILRTELGFIIVGVYVDDLILATSTPAIKAYFNEAFEAKFEQSPDSDDNVYLGLEFETSPDLDHIALNCPKLWRKLRESIPDSVTLPRVVQPVPADVLDLIYMPVHETTNRLVPKSECDVRSLLGIAAWGVQACRPAEAFSAGVLCRRAHIPTEMFITVLYGFISYLLDHERDQMHITDDGTPMFSSSVDSSFGNCPETQRSWFGYALNWCGVTFCYRSALLPLVLPSTRDSEAAAMVYCIKAMLAKFILLTELKFAPEGVTPLPVGTDSAAALANSLSDHVHRDSRWTSLRLGFIRDMVKNMLIRTYKLPTDEMPSDCLTKAPKTGAAHARARARHMGKAP